MADLPNPSLPPSPAPALKPALSAPSAPKPVVKLPSPPPAPTTAGIPPPPSAIPGAPAINRPPAHAVQAPKVGSVLETNFVETVATKEPAPLVALDFLALAASIAFGVLLLNDYLTLINKPFFN
jgi:hypothetical protein